MTRSVWVDAGNDPDPAKLANHGITVPFLDARWVAAKSDPLGYLKWIRAFTGVQGVGLYLCDPWQWKDDGAPTDPVKWALYAYDLVQHQCAPGTSGNFPQVHLNYEHDDPAWLLAMLQQWRKNSPKRATAWTMQAHKYSVYAGVAEAVASLSIAIIPQCYTGDDMTRVESATEVRCWRAMAGASAVVYPMLDAKQLGVWWDGVAFTMGRLP